MKFKENLEICQDKAQKKTRELAEKNMSSLDDIFDVLMRTASKTLHPIWNKYDLMVSKENDAVGDLILLGSSIEGMDTRELFESVLSVFITGLKPVRQLIFDGYYTQSSSILRTNIELIVQLDNILKKKYKEKKAPNIKDLDMNLKKVYSELTGLAHLSSSDDLKSFTQGDYDGDKSLVTPLLKTLTPTYRGNISKILFALHIVTSIDALVIVENYLKLNDLVEGLDISKLDTLRVLHKEVWGSYLAE